MTDSSDEAAAPTRSYAIVAVVAGAAFAIIAVSHVPGVLYAIVGILLGLAYAMLAVSRRYSGGGRNRQRDR